MSPFKPVVKTVETYEYCEIILEHKWRDDGTCVYCEKPRGVVRDPRFCDAIADLIDEEDSS